MVKVGGATACASFTSLTTTTGNTRLGSTNRVPPPSNSRTSPLPVLNCFSTTRRSFQQATLESHNQSAAAHPQSQLGIPFRFPSSGCLQSSYAPSQPPEAIRFFLAGIKRDEHRPTLELRVPGRRIGGRRESVSSRPRLPMADRDRVGSESVSTPPRGASW